jgi:hypothetical protein
MIILIEEYTVQIENRRYPCGKIKIKAGSRATLKIKKNKN